MQTQGTIALWNRDVKHMKKINTLLLCLMGMVWLQDIHAEVILQTTFGQNLQQITDNKSATGQIPKDVVEDSGWAKLKVHYSTEIDPYGGVLKWTRAHVQELTNGRAQLKWNIPSPDQTSTYRLNINLASETKSRVTLFVARTESPYTVYWKETFVPGDRREEHLFDFRLPVIEHDISLVLGMDQIGSYDIVSAELTKRSEKEIAEARAEAIAAAPDNLAPNAGFALGLPTAWAAGREFSIRDKVSFKPAAEAGPYGTIPLRIDVIEKGMSYVVYSAPFGIPDPESVYTVSFIAKGEGQGEVKVFADGSSVGSGSYTADPKGKQVDIQFQGKDLVKWYVIHWTGSDDVQIDALNVSLGEQAKPFTLPGKVEVALAAGFEKANVFVEGVDAPAIEYALTGKIEKGMVLKTRTFNLGA